VPGARTGQNRPMSGDTSATRRELELARRVHYSMLPGPYADEALEMGLAYAPAAHVGGDFCHFQPLAPGRYFASISDVTGHGVAAALMVARVNSFVRASGDAQAEPGTLVQDLNRFLCDHFSDLGLLLSFYACCLDLQREEVRTCGAGHPPAMLLGADGNVRRIESGNPPLGVSCTGACSLEERRERVTAGDTLVLLTDGLLELRRPGATFGLDDLEVSLRGLAGRPA